MANFGQKFWDKLKNLITPAALPSSPTPTTRAEPEIFPAELIRWQQAMPVCLLPFFPQMIKNADNLEYNQMRLALLEEYHSPAKMALELLAWYGQGAGSWSDFPAYELVAEQFLMELPLPILLEALSDYPLKLAHLEGAARLFSRDLFIHWREQELKQIPAGVKLALLEHVTAGGEAEKIKAVQAIQ